MKTILILSYKEDKHAQYIIRRIKKRGLKTKLVDLSLFPEKNEISFAISNSSPQSSSVKSLRTQIKDEEVAGIWCRRLGGRTVAQLRSGMDRYIASESATVVDSVEYLFPGATWISKPQNTRLANRKIAQLVLAEKIGFQIPDTLISNSPEQVEKFIEQSGDKPVIMKPAGSALIRLSNKVESNQNKLVYTKIIDKKEVRKNLRDVKNCPVIFQSAVMKDYDLRVTVIRDQVYTAKIQITGCDDPTNLDWRNIQGYQEYSRHELPFEVKRDCIRIVNELGLEFGCIDLGYSKSSGYTFFEVNPQGQWLPSEIRLGYDISGHLIDSLSS